MCDIIGCFIELGKCFSICFSDIGARCRGEEIRRDHGPEHSGGTSTISSQPTSTSMSVGQVPPKRYEWNELTVPPKPTIPPH
ncbi:unnamed protein product [Peniophora sp. CBMAI 1063]|nr:unnamed protein product [Peniophora sp. CBMAI 1063]